ncbi:MAG: diacylglycerol kinase family protein, partial [Candidatus Binatia bacterium]
MSAKPSLLIVNRKSGSGKSDLATGLALLRERGLTLIEHYPDDVRRMPQIIRDHVEGVDRIILGGGDGTFNAAAEALVEARLPLGILPLGTANDLARSLKIPLSLPEACG